MSGDLTPSDSSDPLSLLGLASGASEQEVRSRYLDLVRQFPPERDPAKFQEIHAAYQAASDPLVTARALIAFDDDEPRPWSEIIAEHKANPPRLGVDVLLSLGNRN
jgi:curved DNA-binding protein CbpA